MNGKIKLLMLISVMTIALPLLGFPRTTKNIILFVLGSGGVLLILSIKRGVRILRLKVKRFEQQQNDIVTTIDTQ
jgi:hypothetical protein